MKNILGFASLLAIVFSFGFIFTPAHTFASTVNGYNSPSGAPIGHYTYITHAGPAAALASEPVSFTPMTRPYTGSYGGTIGNTNSGVSNSGVNSGVSYTGNGNVGGYGKTGTGTANYTGGGVVSGYNKP